MWVGSSPWALVTAASGRTARTREPSRTVTPQFHQAGARILLQASRHARKKALFSLHENHVHFIRRDVPVVLQQGTVDQLCQRPGILHSGGAPTDDGEPKQGATLLRVRCLGRPLEAGQHVVAEGDGVVHRPQREGMAGSTLDIEEVRDAARSENHIVVVQRAAVRDDGPSLEVELAQLRLPEVDQRLSSEETPYGVGDLSRTELGGGHLVEEREEGVIVVAVEHDHPQPVPDEAPRRPQAPEARTHDHDPRMRWRVHGLVLREARVDLVHPGEDASCEVVHTPEARVHQCAGGHEATRPGPAVHHNLSIAGQLVHPIG